MVKCEKEFRSWSWFGRNGRGTGTEACSTKFQVFKGVAVAQRDCGKERRENDRTARCRVERCEAERMLLMYHGIVKMSLGGFNHLPWDLGKAIRDVCRRLDMECAGEL
ncbi:hypothetical protein F511_21321 [Dorcoceras hygrometricum]|uniref:Uncharacterized protein n=1 Tax=Dorcoceras hygrometricum TaxID=472368 RepID=A0A2Z7DIM0_9LAMI|nr:hypothetical protein F511_21321 [Dorcoceras hygrometricum]